MNTNFYCIISNICGAIFLWIAQADRFDAVERVGVAASHRGLLHDKVVFEYLQKWLGVDQKVRKHSKSSKVVDAST